MILFPYMGVVLNSSVFIDIFSGCMPLLVALCRPEFTGIADTFRGNMLLLVAFLYSQYFKSTAARALITNPHRQL